MAPLHRNHGGAVMPQGAVMPHSPLHVLPPPELNSFLIFICAAFKANKAVMRGSHRETAIAFYWVQVS
jgi:hypothetical protein